ncbi:MAG TPA: hypothetical protein VHF25_02850 [Nitriliruptorales bacterium]|nr:hypothetical protein [Nitriliruptorales bacterium]
MHDWWDLSLGLTRSCAELDLRADGAVRPRLLAWQGERPLLVAEARPFPRGDYAAPLIELFALVAPLDADRLALVLPARAWSLSDPMPPVVRGVGDLRQRVLAVERVDGHGAPLRTESTLLPFDVTEGVVHWAEPVSPGPADGWIPGAVEATVRERHRLRCPPEQVRAQALRCVRLGHTLVLERQVAERLRLDPVPEAPAAGGAAQPSEPWRPPGR